MNKYYKHNQHGTTNSLFCLIGNINVKPFKAHHLLNGKGVRQKYNNNTNIQLLKGHYSFGVIKQYQLYKDEYMIELTKSRRGVMYEKSHLVYCKEGDFKII